MAGVIYWRIHANIAGHLYVYFKTKNRFIPEMIVDLAVRHKELNEAFADRVDEVIEISESEYFEHMWE